MIWAPAFAGERTRGGFREEAAPLSFGRLPDKLPPMRGIAIIALLLAGSAAGTPPGITSAYTTLALDRCTQLDKGETPEWTEWRCSGHRGIALFVQNSDDRYDVDAGVEDKGALWADTFDYPGKTVEWRLHAGKPFAVIYRLVSANPERERTSTLVVETVGTRGKPGCRVAMIPGSAAKANEQARAAADKILNGRTTCLKAE